MRKNEYDLFLKWKESGKGRPLVLIGPRFVGKTWLVKHFGEKEFKQVIYINLEEMKEINELFSKDIPYEELLNKTANLFGFFEFNPNETLFIVEEIQNSPNILDLMKYIHEKIPPFYLIITSSNPGVFLNENIDIFKDKVQIINMKPLSFDMFLNFINHNLYLEYSKISFDNNIDKIIHNQLNNILLNYLACGGYPLNVLTYKSSKNLNKVDASIDNLIKDVKYDFTINSQDIKPKWILQIWDSIPSQLNNKLKKFIFTQLGQNVRSREYFDVIKWLVKSMLIYKLDQVKNPNNKIPLKNNVEKKGYRLLLNDVGIAKRLLSITNEQIFLNKEYPNKNVFFEIFVYSQLSYLFKRKNMVYYSKGNFELDILLEYRELLIPINIKGSLLKANNAMKNYIKHNDVSIAIQYSFNYLKFENNLLIIPFYLINKTKEFLDFIINQNLHDKK